MAKDVVVHIQRYDGTWDILGQTVARGIDPDDVELSVDEHGPKTASFTLRRTRGALWPDVRKYARVLVQVGGLDVWGGRVADTPVKDDADTSMSVQCEGAQAHLDDDVYERAYVHTNLGDWKDLRGFPQITLRNGMAAGQVGTDGGITIGFPKDTELPGSVYPWSGVQLDLGPGQGAKRLVVDWAKVSAIGGTGYYDFIIRATDDGDPVGATGAYDDLVTTDLASLAGSGTAGYTLSTARRYVSIAVYYKNASASTPGEDQVVRLSSLQVFSDTAYESGNASILTLDTVARDAVDRASVLFDSDRSLITAPSDVFYIPEFAFTEPRTPRQAIEAGNVFQDMQYGVDHRWRVFLRDRPALSAAEVEIGAWSGSQAEDQGDGDEIYSRCIVKASAQDGSPIRASRTQSDQPGAQTETIDSPALSNPTFASNASGWTAGASTITRDTVTYDTSPASGRWDNTGASDALTNLDSLEASFTGTFLPGRLYVLRIRARKTLISGTGVAGTTAYFGQVPSTANYGQLLMNAASGAWTTFSIPWMPTELTTSAKLRLVAQGGHYWHLDSVVLLAASPTIVDRAGFVRTKVIDASFMLTDPAAVRIADKYLGGHKTSPFKGRRTLTGPRSVRNSLTGQYEGLERLLLRYGQPLLDTSATDPDTGLPGRAGRIATVSYKPEPDTAVVELDNSRANFEALLERIGLVIGQGTR